MTHLIVIKKNFKMFKRLQISLISFCGAVRTGREDKLVRHTNQEGFLFLQKKTVIVSFFDRVLRKENPPKYHQLYLEGLSYIMQ